MINASGTNYSAEYIHGEEEYAGLPDATARVLLAVGCGPAHLPSGDHSLCSAARAHGLFV
jgi:hypothetical protein